MPSKPFTKKEKELEKMLETGTYALVWLMAAFTTSFGCYIAFF